MKKIISILLVIVMVLSLGTVAFATEGQETGRLGTQTAADRVQAYEKEVAVSQSEYQLLLLLLENKGKTVTRRQLLEQIWDNSGNYVNDNTLTVTMKRLREKLNHPLCLKTIRSFGYRMEDTK